MLFLLKYVFAILGFVSAAPAVFCLHLVMRRATASCPIRHGLWSIHKLCPLQPEYTDDVQKYDVSTYLRRTDAHRCRVNSSIFVPLYDNELRQRPIGVFEACKANSADFLGMFTVLVRALQVCSFEICDFCLTFET